MGDDNHNKPHLSDDFQAASAIEAACALYHMTGQDVSEQGLRSRYRGADDETILRIVDTLHVYRFDWMEDTVTQLTGLMNHVPEHLHPQVLDEALDLAFMRLKHIGFLQKSGDYLSDMENDIICEGKDRFPELYDASEEAEDQTRQAIRKISSMQAYMAIGLSMRPAGVSSPSKKLNP